MALGTSRLAGQSPAALWQALRRPGALVWPGTLLVAGCAISTVCYALTIRATLGLGPLYVVQAGLATIEGSSIGTAVMVVGVACVLLALALRAWPGPGTVALPFLSGALLNLILPGIPPIHGWALRVVTVVGATWVMALGGALMIGAGLGPSAYDCVMLGLRRVSGWSITPIRAAMELSMLLLGSLLGGPVGAGTVITGVLIGPAMHFWMHVLGVTPAAQAQPSAGSSPVTSPGSASVP